MGPCCIYKAGTEYLMCGWQLPCIGGGGQPLGLFFLTSLTYALQRKGGARKHAQNTSLFLNLASICYVECNPHQKRTLCSNDTLFYTSAAREHTHQHENTLLCNDTPTSASIYSTLGSRVRLLDVRAVYPLSGTRVVIRSRGDEVPLAHLRRACLVNSSVILLGSCVVRHGRCQGHNGEPARWGAGKEASQKHAGVANTAVQT